jgi:hypothetical protein
MKFLLKKYQNIIYSYIYFKFKIFYEKNISIKDKLIRRLKISYDLIGNFKSFKAYWTFNIIFD